MFIYSNLSFCEHIEDLFDRSLLQRIFRNLEALLVGFELTEDLADGDTRVNSEAVEIREVLDDIK